MLTLTECWVPGRPKTKGSLDVVNASTGHVRENVAGSARWRLLVADAVRRDRARRFGADARPSVFPVAVRCAFWLPPPANPAGEWRDAPIHTRAGDVDKLARNVLDALANDAANAAMNGGAYVNDVQVCDLRAVKLLATPPGLLPGLLLSVWELAPAYLDDEARTFTHLRALVTA